MIELEKMRASTSDNFYNFDAHWIIEILSVLQSAYVVPRDQDKVVFYINNYINWDQFNQLYDLDWMEKDTRNVDAIAYKLGPALIRATNHRLENVKKEKWKREEIVKRRKAKALAIERCRARGGISSSSVEEENDESDTKDDMDLDQTDNKYPLQL